MSEEVEVTQADRKGAAPAIKYLKRRLILSPDCEAAIYEAFARHRLAERERCAKVAETYITGGRDEWDRGSDHAAKGIARNLRPTPSPIAPRV